MDLLAANCNTYAIPNHIHRNRIKITKFVPVYYGWYNGFYHLQQFVIPITYSDKPYNNYYESIE